MPKKYTSEQFWKLYEKLPQKLKDSLFSEGTGDNIYEICKRYEIEEDLEQVVECVGQVLVGVLTPADLEKTLEQDLKIENETAKKIALEINRFIFYPVKNELAELYKMDIAPEEKPAGITPPLREEPQTSSEKDTYREEIE